jgi:hypothetical protein
MKFIKMHLFHEISMAFTDKKGTSLESMKRKLFIMNR